LGVSLIHFAMFFTILLVIPPDIETAKSFDDEYYQTVVNKLEAMGSENHFDKEDFNFFKS